MLDPTLVSRVHDDRLLPQQPISDPDSQRHLTDVADVLYAALQRPLVGLETEQITARNGERPLRRHGEPERATGPYRTGRTERQRFGVAPCVGATAQTDD